MIKMYAVGAFPMADKDTNEINWYMPEVRTIIPLDNYNYPRSLKKFIAGSEFTFKYDSDFHSVVKYCTDREETWISDEQIEAYPRMEKLGYVHKVIPYSHG